MSLRLHISSDNAPLAAGELRIEGRAREGTERRDAASLALEHGPTSFESHGETLTTLVLPAEPTLDDLLAAAILEHQIEGQSLPSGLQAFTRYTALAREGLRPAPAIPLAVSLEGVFAAVRRTAGDDLGDSGVRRRFVEGWRRIADRVFEAAEADQDPHVNVLFDGSAFARERAFLENDEQLYRQDVQRGQSWRVRLPGGPPEATALLLDRPKSLLFKYWSRSSDTASDSEGALFLAVNWHGGNWVFSTDPVHRLDLKELAARLQTAENAAKGGAAGTWFDGAPFSHTLVAAPKTGTRLRDERVIALVRQWAGARAAHSTSRRTRWVAAIAMILMVSLAAAFALDLFERDPVETNDRGLTRDQPPSIDPIGEAGSTPGRLITLSIGISEYQDPTYRLHYADDDARALAAAFGAVRNPLFQDAPSHVLLNERATKDGILRALQGLLKSSNRPTQDDLLVVTLAGHGKVNENGYFFFLPHDYDERRVLESTAIAWEDFQRTLGHLPCMVLVVLDACHAGAISSRLGLRGPGEDPTQQLVRQALAGFADSQKGLVVMAGSLGAQSSRESEEWGHGAFTLALLECLEGRHLLESPTETPLPQGTTERPWLSMADVSSYVSRRVAELSLSVGSTQDVVTDQTGGIALGSLLITSARK